MSTEALFCTKVPAYKRSRGWQKCENSHHLVSPAKRYTLYFIPATRWSSTETCPHCIGWPGNPGTHGSWMVPFRTRRKEPFVRSRVLAIAANYSSYAAIQSVMLRPPAGARQVGRHPGTHHRKYSSYMGREQSSRNKLEQCVCGGRKLQEKVFEENRKKVFRFFAQAAPPFFFQLSTYPRVLGLVFGCVRAFQT